MENIINLLKIIKDVYYINISDNLEEWNYIPNQTFIEFMGIKLGKYILDELYINYNQLLAKARAEIIIYLYSVYNFNESNFSEILTCALLNNDYIYLQLDLKVEYNLYTSYHIYYYEILPFICIIYLYFTNHTFIYTDSYIVDYILNLKQINLYYFKCKYNLNINEVENIRTYNSIFINDILDDSQKIINDEGGINFNIDKCWDSLITYINEYISDDDKIKFKNWGDYKVKEFDLKMKNV